MKIPSHIHCEIYIEKLFDSIFNMIITKANIYRITLAAIKKLINCKI